MTTIAASTVSLPSLAKAPTKRSLKKVTAPSVGGFCGLKASNSLATVQKERSTEHQFALISASLRNGSKGGALTASCNLASEIFSVVPIIAGLVLTGVALGFVLLRVEAWVEETAEE